MITVVLCNGRRDLHDPLTPGKDITQQNVKKFCLDTSRGADYWHDGEDVHHRRAGDRLRHRGERGVWFGAGAAGGDGVICSLWEAASTAASHKNVSESIPGNCE